MYCLALNFSHATFEFADIAGLRQARVVHLLL